MEPVAEWLAGVASITAGLVGWHRRHAHLDGQPVGPLGRHFRAARASAILWLVSVTCLSGICWGLPLISGWHQLGVMGVLLVSLLAFIPVWNWRLRRRAAVQDA